MSRGRGEVLRFSHVGMWKQTRVQGVILPSTPDLEFMHLVSHLRWMLRWFLRRKFRSSLWNLSLNRWSWMFLRQSMGQPLSSWLIRPLRSCVQLEWSPTCLLCACRRIPPSLGGLPPLPDILGTLAPLPDLQAEPRCSAPSALVMPFFLWGWPLE